MCFEIFFAFFIYSFSCLLISPTRTFVILWCSFLYLISIIFLISPKPGVDFANLLTLSIFLSVVFDILLDIFYMVLDGLKTDFTIFKEYSLNIFVFFISFTKPLSSINVFLY